MAVDPLSYAEILSVILPSPSAIQPLACKNTRINKNVYIYIYTYVYVCTYVRMYMCIYTYIHTYMHVCMCIRTYVCTCLYMKENEVQKLRNTSPN